MQLYEHQSFHWLVERGFPVAPFELLSSRQELAHVALPGPWRVKVQMQASVGEWGILETEELSAAASLWGKRFMPSEAEPSGRVVQQLLVQSLPEKPLHMMRWAICAGTLLRPEKLNQTLDQLFIEEELLEMSIEWSGEQIVGAFLHADPDALFRQPQWRVYVDHSQSLAVKAFAERYGFGYLPARGGMTLLISDDQGIALHALDRYAAIGGTTQGAILLREETPESMLQLIKLSCHIGSSLLMIALSHRQSSLKFIQKLLQAMLQYKTPLKTRVVIYATDREQQRAHNLCLQLPWRVTLHNSLEEMLQKAALKELRACI